MKICFLCPSLEECGGVQRITVVLANALSKKYQVSVISINNNRETSYYALNPEIEQIYYNQFRFRKGYLLSGMIRMAVRRFPVVLPAEIAKRVYFPEYICRDLGELLAQKHYDCVIGCTGHCAILLGILKKYLPDVRLLGWQHNSYKIYYETRGKGFFVLRRLAERAYRDLDHVVTLTGKDAGEYREKMNLDCCYIYNPLGFQSNRKSSVENKNIIFVSRLEIQQKGLDLLVEIMRILLIERKHQDWKFQIVGMGSGYLQLKQWIEDAGIQDYVEMLGEQSDVVPFYCEASVFVSTSRWEGFGLVVTEAMECGLPVVSFCTDGPAEIIQHGKNGFVVDNYSLEQFADAVEKLMLDEKLRKQFSVEAVKRAEDFQLEKIVEKWERLIHE